MPGEVAEQLGRALEHRPADERADGDDRRGGLGSAARIRAARGSGRSRRSGSTGRSRSRRRPRVERGERGPPDVAARRPVRADPRRSTPAPGRRRAEQPDPLQRPGRALDDHELLERQTRPRAAIAVGAGSSHIGSTRAATPIAATTAACASVSVAPARSSSLRIRHIARSRSPSRNQVGRAGGVERVHHLPGVAADARSRARRSRRRASR